MGPEANVLHCAVRISLWLFWTEGSYLCLSSTEHFSLFPLRAITCDRPGTADAWITKSQNILGLLCADLHLSAFSSMAIRRKHYRPRYHRTGTRFRLWHAFIRRQDISAQSDSDNDNDTDDIIGTNFTQWTDNTNCWPTVPLVHRFTGDPSVVQQTEPPYINNDPSPSPLSVLNARQGRQAPSTGHLKRLTQAATDTGLSVWENWVRCVFCTTQRNKNEI